MNGFGKKDIRIIILGVFIVVSVFFGVNYIIDSKSPTSIHNKLITNIRKAAYKYGRDNVKYFEENKDMYMNVDALITSGYLASNSSDGISYINNLSNDDFKGAVYIYYDNNKIRTYYFENYDLSSNNGLQNKPEIDSNADFEVLVDNVTSNSIVVSVKELNSEFYFLEYYLDDYLVSGTEEKQYIYQNLTYGIHALKVVGYTTENKKVEKTIAVSTQKLEKPVISQKGNIVTIKYLVNSENYIYEYKLNNGDWVQVYTNVFNLDITNDGNIVARISDGYNIVESSVLNLKYIKEESSDSEQEDDIIQEEPEVNDSEENKPESIVYYNINFDLNGGVGKIQSQKVTSSSSVIKPIVEPTKEGYEFLGWYKDNKQYNFNNPVYGEFTLVAQWSKKEIKKFSITFDYNDDTNNSDYIKVEAGTKLEQPDDPIFDGYDFVGWYKDGQKYNFNNIVNSNFTLTAKWKKIEVINYKIVLDYNDGTGKKDTITVKAGGKFTQPVAPSRKGYVFSGWYKNGKTYNFNSVVNSDITLTAKWIKNNTKSYYVTIDYDDGISDEDIIVVEEGKRLKRPSTPSKNNYEFSGWHKGNELYDFSSPVNENFTLTAKWEKVEKIKYTVTFDYNDDTNRKYKAIVEEGNKVSKPTEPSRSGYTFKGWYLDNNIYSFGKTVVENITLKAKWEVIPKENYVVIFDYNDGTGTTKTYNIEEGKKVNEPSDPTRAGYKFKGWYKNNKLYNFNDAVYTSFVLKATWQSIDKNKYIVTCDFNDGTAQTISYIVEDGNRLSKPNDPIRDGYIFKGWYIEDTNSQYNFDTSVTKNINLIANWQRKVFTVTFNSNGGSSVASQNIEYGETVIKPSDPSRSGYAFKGWFIGDNQYKFDALVTKGITLTAKWEKNEAKKYSVTFNSDGGSNVPSQIVSENFKATRPSNPTKVGYTFEAWYLNGSVYQFDKPVTGDIILKARWKEIPKNIYNVLFDYNDGTGTTKTYNIEEGKRVDELFALSRTGYIFKGWYYGSNEYDFSKPVMQNITLKAKWEKETYLVSFDSLGGSHVEPQSVVYKGTAKEPSDPTRTGYTFLGWYLDDSVYDFDTTLVIEHIMLTAKWKEISKNTYTVTFNYNDGTGKTKTSNVIEGELVVPPSDPTRSGYYFLGWFIENNRYNFDKMVEGNMILTAKWEKIMYTVTFDSNGGSSVASQSVAPNETVKQPSIPTREGATFEGWYHGSKKYDFSKPVTSDLILTAKWVGKLISSNIVVFDYNDGSGKASSSNVTSGEIISKPTDPTRVGYTFLGWYHGSKKYDFSKPVTSDLILTAKWEEIPKNTYTVTFDYNDGSGKTKTSSVTEGNKVNKPTDPTRSNYTFEGWYNGDTKYDFSKKVTGDINLKAKWKTYVPEAAIVKYKIDQYSGKWVFINNPERLTTSHIYSNSGRALHRNTIGTGTSEIYFEHALTFNAYYTVRFYNPTDASIQLKINKCGTSLVTGVNDSGYIKTWEQYYGYATCSLKGKEYTIAPHSSQYIYLSKKQGKPEFSSSVPGASAKISANTVFDGVLNVNSTGELIVESFVFTTANSSQLPQKPTAAQENHLDSKGNASVYSGHYSGLPQVTSDINFEINDNTPNGNLKVKYNSESSSERDVWYTHDNGTINQSYKKDMIKLSVYPKTLTAWNWGNWAVHYTENITIKNTGTEDKFVKYYINSYYAIDKAGYDNDLGSAVVAFPTNKNLKYVINRAYDDQIGEWHTTDDWLVIWEIKVPAGKSITVPTKVLLGGNSHGTLGRKLEVSDKHS